MQLTDLISEYISLISLASNPHYFVWRAKPRVFPRVPLLRKPPRSRDYELQRAKPRRKHVTSQRRSLPPAAARRLASADPTGVILPLLVYNLDLYYYSLC
ncbi:hypothetical protein O0L34_g11372 [Tuta absoluta]|nr:hypothetical protein O0L34_g11372 [Tuta absoluta]